MAKVGFVFVPADFTDTFKEAHLSEGITSDDNYYNKVAFLDGTKEIATNGSIFGQTIKYELLTQDEYDALSEKDEHTLYLIKETE